MIRIRSVEPRESFKVQLALSDGTSVERDLEPLLVEPLYSALRQDRRLFESMEVVDGTIGWPNGLDLDPDMVIWGGPPPPADSVPRAV